MLTPAVKRHKTRAVWIGDVKVGGSAPVSVQSMTKTRTEDVKSTVRQIRELADLGCEIIRLAIPNQTAARQISVIKKQIHIPIEVDIHFNPKLALECIKQGADAVRLNPGNITDQAAVAEIVKQARRKKISIRVGVNSGSVAGWKKKIHATRDTRHDTAQMMVDCAVDYCQYLESLKFKDIIVSLKASDLDSTIRAYRAFAQKTDYPLHLGVTAAGPLLSAAVKSALGLGILLREGIGDTIRISVTGPPHDEVQIGYEILETTGLRSRGWQIISCPTCGRCEIDIVNIVNRVETALRRSAFRIPHSPLKIALMGCVVNGPGEAIEADIGIAGGRDFAWLFRHGQKIRKIPARQIIPKLIKEIKTIVTA